VVDYRHGERTAKDMKIFLENEMPNYSERITFGQQDLDKAMKNAEKYGMSVPLLCTSKPKTSPFGEILVDRIPSSTLIDINPSYCQ
jgi:hypothetical protein